MEILGLLESEIGFAPICPLSSLACSVGTEGASNRSGRHGGKAPQASEDPDRWRRQDRRSASCLAATTPVLSAESNPEGMVVCKRELQCALSSALQLILMAKPISEGAASGRRTHLRFRYRGRSGRESASGQSIVALAIHPGSSSCTWPLSPSCKSGDRRVPVCNGNHLTSTDALIVIGAPQENPS